MIRLAPLSLSLLAAICSISAASAAPEDGRVVDLQVLTETGAPFTLTPTAPVSLYDSRAARRVLDKFPAGRPLTILAMDKFGLQVRGQATNGLITGWIGQKAVLDAKGQDTLAALFARQTLVEDLVARKQPAVGMTFAELSRILGPATSHTIVAEGAGRTESATWVKTQKIDLNDTLDIGLNSTLLKVDVETGRIAVELRNGVTVSINASLEGGAPEIPTVPAPITPPFQRATPALTTTSP